MKRDISLVHSDVSKARNRSLQTTFLSMHPLVFSSRQVDFPLVFLCVPSHATRQSFIRSRGALRNEQLVVTQGNKKRDFCEGLKKINLVHARKKKVNSLS